MANATSKAQSSTVAWSDDKVKRDLAATAATYYPGTMIAVNASGYAVKCDDTAGLRFDGLMADSFRITVESTDSAGDKKVTVEKPWLFTMTIASAAITDVGRKVYALYDNEVAYSGTSNSILVGVVEAYVNATTVLVRPYWTSTSGVNAFDGETLTFTGATGANDINIPDNLADAMSVRQGANDYLTFVTTNSGELMVASKKLRFIDSAPLSLGTGDDIVFTWDGTDLDITQAAANSSIKWGVDGAGIDQVHYGDTASAHYTWDQSADVLIFGGVAGIQNLKVKQSTAVAITGATSIALADSGGHFSVSQASAYDIDLPSPTTGAGATYFFYLTGAAANNVTLTVAGSAATFVGTITIDGATIVATGSTLTFASGASALGDSIMVRSIATNLYHVVAIASAAGGITIA